MPQVLASHSCATVITEEWVRGCKIDDLAALDAAGIDRPAVARLFAAACLTMVFEHGFFHADPTPATCSSRPPTASAASISGWWVGSPRRRWSGSASCSSLSPVPTPNASSTGCAISAWRVTGSTTTIASGAVSMARRRNAASSRLPGRFGCPTTARRLRPIRSVAPVVTRTGRTTRLRPRAVMVHLRRQ
ncbi:MAG: AarF/UbiB family protein [Actinomycetota bacterium]